MSACMGGCGTEINPAGMCSGCVEGVRILNANAIRRATRSSASPPKPEGGPLVTLSLDALQGACLCGSCIGKIQAIIAAAPRPPSSPDPGERCHECDLGKTARSPFHVPTCARWCAPSPAAVEPVKCATFGGEIPLDVRARMDADRRAAEAAAPPPGGEQYRFCDFTDCLRKPEPGSRYCYEHADRAPASQPEKKEGTTDGA